jgi:hypothetical protein
MLANLYWRPPTTFMTHLAVTEGDAERGHVTDDEYRSDYLRRRRPTHGSRRAQRGHLRGTVRTA